MCSVPDQVHPAGPLVDRDLPADNRSLLRPGGFRARDPLSTVGSQCAVWRPAGDRGWFAFQAMGGTQRFAREANLWFDRRAWSMWTMTAPGRSSSETLRWLRVVGDTIFAVGVLALGWFVLGLKAGWSNED